MKKEEEAIVRILFSRNSWLERGTGYSPTMNRARLGNVTNRSPCFLVKISMFTGPGEPSRANYHSERRFNSLRRAEEPTRAPATSVYELPTGFLSPASPPPSTAVLACREFRAAIHGNAGLGTYFVNGECFRRLLCLQLLARERPGSLKFPGGKPELARTRRCSARLFSFRFVPLREYRRRVEANVGFRGLNSEP